MYPDGWQVEIVEREQGALSKWSFGGVPAEKAIKGFGGAILYSGAPDKTARLLEQVMGLQKLGTEGPYARFIATGDLGNVIDVNIASMPMGSWRSGYGAPYCMARIR